MIETILTVLSFLAVVSLFLYVLSYYNNLKDKYAKKKLNIKKSSNMTVSSNINYNDSPSKTNNFTTSNYTLKERTCPLCKSRLSKYEALYASKIIGKDSTKILIYGCKYCYKPDEDSNKIKKTDI